MTDNERIQSAVALIEEYGGIDGGHHKQWLLDQVMRALLQEQYAAWREEYDNYLDEDGNTYSEWDEGVAP